MLIGQKINFYTIKEGSRIDMKNISELKTQFILSERGITPCWLVRENGEPVWRPFMGLIGIPDRKSVV